MFWIILSALGLLALAHARRTAYKQGQAEQARFIESRDADASLTRYLEARDANIRYEEHYNAIRQEPGRLL